MKAKHLIEHFVRCREIIIKNIHAYISNIPNKSLSLTTKDTEGIFESILEEENIIPLKIFIQEDNVWLEYYNKEEYEEFKENAYSYTDRIEDFSADEIYAVLVIIEKIENLNKL